MPGDIGIDINMDTDRILDIEVDTKYKICILPKRGEYKAVARSFCQPSLPHTLKLRADVPMQVRPFFEQLPEGPRTQHNAIALGIH